MYLHGYDKQTFNSLCLTLTERIVHEIKPSILSFQKSNSSVLVHTPGWVKAMEGLCNWFHCVQETSANEAWSAEHSIFKL